MDIQDPFEGYAAKRKSTPKTALEKLQEAGGEALSVEDIAALGLQARREETTLVLREAARLLRTRLAEIDLVEKRSQSRSVIATAKFISNPAPDDTFETVHRKANYSRQQAAAAGCLTPLFEKEVAVAEKKALRAIAFRDQRRFLMYRGNAEWTKEYIDTQFDRVILQLEQAGIDLSPKKKQALEDARSLLCEGSAAKRIEKLSKACSIDTNINAIKAENDIILKLIPAKNEALLGSWNTTKARLLKRGEGCQPHKTKDNKRSTADQLWQYQR